jgi:hypothetical protein
MTIILTAAPDVAVGFGEGPVPGFGLQLVEANATAIKKAIHSKIFFFMFYPLVDFGTNVSFAPIKNMIPQ